MASLKVIRKRIVSVRNTQQVTKAMKMVSAAKLRRAQAAAESARSYSDKLTELLRGLASAEEGEAPHPFLRPGSDAPAQLIVITGDKGLCGAYNASIIRMATAFLAEERGRGATLTVIGRRAREFFAKRAPDSIVAEHVGVTPDLALARAIGRHAAERFVAGEAGEVYVVYTRFRSAISQIPTLDRLLPLRDEAATEATPQQGIGRDYVYEPDPRSILDSLLPRYIETRIYHAMLESAASEHGARMTAMDSATRNASEMIGRLTLAMNRARQAGITTELMEIVGGAEALKG